MPTALPPDFAWHPRSIGAHDDGSMVLLFGTREIALVNRRADGVTWKSEVNRHLQDWKRMRHCVHRGPGQAVRMAERWVAVHADRIRAEVLATEKPSIWGVRYGRDGCDDAAPSSPA